MAFSLREAEDSAVVGEGVEVKVVQQLLQALPQLPVLLRQPVERQLRQVRVVVPLHPVQRRAPEAPRPLI